MASAWLILPTYNEAQNIEPMVRAVLPRLAHGGSDPTILVVDDASPDGTGQIADRLAAELAEVRVLHRPRKDGLGRAYLDGFATALRDGAVVYRVGAYRNAAKAIREAGVSVEEMAKQGRVEELAGVGKTIAEKIDALLAEGEIPVSYTHLTLPTTPYV